MTNEGRSAEIRELLDNIDMDHPFTNLHIISTQYGIDEVSKIVTDQYQDLMTMLIKAIGIDSSTTDHLTGEQKLDLEVALKWKQTPELMTLEVVVKAFRSLVDDYQEKFGHKPAAFLIGEGWYEVTEGMEIDGIPIFQGKEHRYEAVRNLEDVRKHT